VVSSPQPGSKSKLKFGTPFGSSSSKKKAAALEAQNKKLLEDYHLGKSTISRLQGEMAEKVSELATLRKDLDSR
jgi:hypothetical protein